jgi:molybdopterin/thiamine biosynthesis adenylyltransferase
MFSDREVERYARHLVLREIGGPGQQKLKAAKVLVMGAGGIGGPAALYLAAAGVGRIGLVDDDKVSLSNLQRQIQFAETDLGRAKVDAARERLGAVNSDVDIVAIERRITPETARDLVRGWEVVIDGTDSFETRAAVGEACVAENATLIAAAIGRWDLQVAVLRGKPCWRCFVPEIPPGGETCAAVGVVGALAGVAGSLAALAAIKAITGAGEDIAGELLIFDALGWRMRTARLTADPACPVCS